MTYAYAARDLGWRVKLRCGIYHISYFTSEDREMPIVYVSMPKIEAKPLQGSDAKLSF